MYKGYQEKLFTNVWGINSGFKSLSDKLNDLLPLQGRCSNPNSKNKYLDKFRAAQNAAYDLFNNGLCNRRASFHNIYGWSVGSRDVKYAQEMTWSYWEDRVEEVLTPIIIKAAKEQGVDTHDDLLDIEEDNHTLRLLSQLGG